MVHFSVKKIKGRPYLYAVKSLRVSDNRTVKLAERVEKRQVTPELLSALETKEAQARARFAAERYSKDLVFNEEAFSRLEGARVEYQRILRNLSAAQRKDLFDRFTANFTYESNALEGNSLTLKDVSIVLSENMVPKGKDLREVFETRNSREVVDGILAGTFHVSEKDALRMHALLVREMRIPPGYETVPNYLRARNLVTTRPGDVPAEMKRLFAWRLENEKRLHPLQLASRFHGRFEKIHPFEDGNGRVGRFLLVTELANRGYPPLIIRKTHRLAYFNALEASDNEHAQKLDRFLLERYKETYDKFFHVYAQYAK